ncbi:hypothetical protein ACFL6N_06130 [Thermodesulfobacteriota bacterium]
MQYSIEKDGVTLLDSTNWDRTRFSQVLYSNGVLVSLPKGNPGQLEFENGLTIVEHPDPVPTTEELLTKAKQMKSSAIEHTFQRESTEPVEVSGIFWKGGIDSGQRLHSAVELARELDMTHVTFTDVDKKAHSLTIAQGMSVITAIGIKYQTDFLTRQARLVEIDEATDEAAVTAVEW